MSGTNKRITIAPGIRLNLNKKSIGMSIGGKRLRYTFNSRTGSKITANLPGIGLSAGAGGSRKTRESAAKRKNRQLRQRARGMNKLEAAEQAKLEVELYENELELLTSAHKESHTPVLWKAVRDSLPPFAEDQQGPRERQAELALKAYQPAFWNKWFKAQDKKLLELEQNMAKAKQEDEEEYRSWTSLTRTAAGVLDGDPHFYRQVIDDMLGYEEITGSGGRLQYSIKDPQTAEVVWEGLTNTLIPTEVKSLTKNGKVSVKAMTKTQYYGLYQDFACSWVLRIALDLFAVLPLETVYVHAYEERVDTATGFPGQAVVLSVAVERKTLAALNLDAIDPSDSLANLEHRMSFHRTGGFQPVEILPHAALPD